MLEAEEGIEPSNTGFANPRLTTWLLRLRWRIFKVGGDCCQHPLSSQMINFCWITLKRINS